MPLLVTNKHPLVDVHRDVITPKDKTNTHFFIFAYIVTLNHSDFLSTDMMSRCGNEHQTTHTHKHMHTKHLINVIRISLYQELLNIYTTFVGIGNSQMSRKLAEITFDLINLFTTSIGEDEAIVAVFTLITRRVICCFENTFGVMRLMST